MPNAPLRPCAGRCGALVPKGRCSSCSRHVEQKRGSAHSRGYGTAWEAFRPQFVQMLLEAGIVPCCGASLPTGPQTLHSRCRDEGLLTLTGLHFDHEPPLQDWERQDARKVCDPNRIQLLCATDHASKTRQERGAGQHV
jgi:hypothetical protein